jgi:3-oxoacyl-[acyl-carrier protein] reductase
VCAALAGQGVDILVAGRRPEKVRRTVDLVRSTGQARVEGAVGDVRCAADVDRVVMTAMSCFGQLDIVVAAAGVGGTGTIPRALSQTSLAEWSTVLQTNVRGVFLTNRAAMAAMKTRGGDIVNIVSARAGTTGHPYAAAYSASKHAIAGLTRQFCDEGRPDRIRVHGLFPDAIDTPLIASSGIPGQRLTPERVADAVVGLLEVPTDALIKFPVLTAWGAPYSTTRRYQVLT